MATVDTDPLFFAEEFTARRRRYIPVRVDIKQIAKDPKYKDYSFPFILGGETAKESDYPLLFGIPLGSKAQFQDAGSYVPTTRFEALSLELYKKGLKKIEAARELIVKSLFVPGLLVNLTGLTAQPRPPKQGEFSSSTGTAAPPSSSMINSTVPVTLQGPLLSLYYEFPLSRYILLMILREPAGGLILISLHSSLIAFIESLKVWRQAISTGGDGGIALIDSIIPRLESEAQQFIEDIVKSNSKADLPSWIFLSKILADKLMQGLPQIKRDAEAAQRVTASVAPGAVLTPAQRDAINDDILRKRISPFFGQLYRLMVPGASLGVSLFAGVVVPSKLDAGGTLADVGQTDQFPFLNTILERDVRDFRTTLTFFDNEIKARKPVVQAYGYLTADFVNYLTDLSMGQIRDRTPANPATPCEDVLFRGSSMTPPPNSVFVDMTTFISALIPDHFGRNVKAEYASSIAAVSSGLANLMNCPASGGKESLPASNAQTIQEFYDSLKLDMTGPPLRRYLIFIAFVYIFFDHIPAAKGAIAALMVPLIGMLGGIIERGSYDGLTMGPMDLLRFDPSGLESVTTVVLARTAFNSSASIESAVRSVLRMFREHHVARNSIRALLRATTDNPAEGITEVGYFDPAKAAPLQTLIDLLKISVKGEADHTSARRIYDNAALKDFILPSPGDSPAILPALLKVGPDNVINRVYELSVRWTHTQEEYVSMAAEILKNDSLADKYRQLSRGRVGYTLAALGGVPLPREPGTSFVLITPDVDTSGKAWYLDAWKAYEGVSLSFFLPSSWEELLYQGYMSDVIIEQQHVRSVAKTLVRPCLQLPETSIVFPSMKELSGGSVVVEGYDIEGDVDLFTTIFEFPADVVRVTYSAGIGVGERGEFALDFFPGQPTGGRGSPAFTMTRQETVDTDTRKIEYHVTSALDITTVVPPLGPGVTGSITAWSKYTFDLFHPVAGLSHRSQYSWSSLDVMALNPPKTPTAPLVFRTPGTGDLFLPALETELFLSSLFDWKLQLYYLVRLRSFLKGRDAFSTELNKINVVMANVLNDSVRKSISEDRKDAADAYIAANTVPNLIEATLPYAGLRNLVYNIVGIEAPASLAKILKMGDLVSSSDLTSDTRKFYMTRAPTEQRAPLEYDISIDDYLILLVARKGFIKPLVEAGDEKKERLTKQATAEREAQLNELIQKSSERLRDPYSVIVNEIVTRALYPRKE